jgi:excinuclease ABC subunit C
VDLARRLDALPIEPGVYLFKNARGRVLYVGKGQNLRARARSYFSSGGDGRARLAHLVDRIADVDVVVTPTVKDALLLENELIKRHRPPFNVRLRDDKQYLMLRLDPRDRWPRLVPVRRFRGDGASYFGPYTSSIALREAISNLRRLFPLRSCSDVVFRDYARRGRPCIEFEMKRCVAPCCDRIDEAAYAELAQGTVLFLRGRSEELVRHLDAQMRCAAEEERFEEAARMRDRIAAVRHTLERQQVVEKRPIDRDVFGLARRGGQMEIHALHVRAGRLIGTAAYAFSDVRLPDAEALGSFLSQYYGDPGRPVPAEILTGFAPADGGVLASLLAERAGHRVVVRTARRGPSRKLVTMAATNAELGLARRIEALGSLEATLGELREQLRLSRPPRRIECYDVSTLGGALAVASRVVFEDGRPLKSDYRRYRIRTAAGGDDLACLREVLERRLARRDSEPLPDLLVVDGGRGQLGVALAALGDQALHVDTLGLAKERDIESPSGRVRRSGGLKAERIYLPGRKDAVLLPPSSAGLLLLQRIRDEAHRFALEFQRSLRQRAGLTSILEEIPGVGPQKRRALLRQLGSLRAVREAGLDRLSEVPGLSARDAAAIRRFFDALQAE